MTCTTGRVALSEPLGESLAALRRFNYEHIYLRPASAEQSRRVIDMLRCLVEHYAAHPGEIADHTHGAAEAGVGLDAPMVRAVGYVAGMTDRFACVQAAARLGWTADRLPRGFDSG